jgi:hypothetical protein
LHASVKAGIRPIITVGEPGTQGAAMTGMQGMGVKTPIAADVALATEGLVKVLHMPKGMMFIIGLLSIIVPTGLLPLITLFCGSTTKALGATPKVHWSCAPVVTSIAILHLPPELCLEYMISFVICQEVNYWGRTCVIRSPDFRDILQMV